MADTTAPSDEAKAVAVAVAALQSPQPAPDSVTVLMPNPSADSPPPENPAPAAAETAPRNSENLLMRILLDKELNKVVIAIAVPIAMAIVVAEKSHFKAWQTSLVLVLLCTGIAAIMCGFLVRHAFPHSYQTGVLKWIRLVATMCVPMGIVLVAAAFFAVVAFFLPPQISWIPIFCFCLCLLCFFAALLCPSPPL